jgi:hypothetical protein
MFDALEGSRAHSALRDVGGRGPQREQAGVAGTALVAGVAGEPGRHARRRGRRTNVLEEQQYDAWAHCAVGRQGSTNKGQAASRLPSTQELYDRLREPRAPRPWLRVPPLISDRGRGSHRMSTPELAAACL